MNKTAYFYDLQTGLFSGQSLGGPAEWVDANVPDGMGAWSDKVDTKSQRVDIETGLLVDYQPDKPADSDSATWAWDQTTRRWVEAKTLAWYKRVKLDQISAARESKNSEPISYDGALFDADELGQRNIQAWTNTIAAGTNPPAGFVWRDFDNVDHPADAAFIVGLNNAIVERGTALYQASWQKKSEVEALTSIDDVIEYDATAGW
jgi:hypothetical protein